MGLRINLERMDPYVWPIGSALLSSGMHAHTAAICFSGSLITPLTGGVFATIWSVFNNALYRAWNTFVHPQHPIMPFKWLICNFSSFALAGITTNAIGFSIAFDAALVLHVTTVGLGIIYGTAAITALALSLPFIVYAKAHMDGITMREATEVIVEPLVNIVEWLAPFPGELARIIFEETLLKLS